MDKLATGKREYTALSNKKCKKCGNHLKHNLIIKRPNARLCYSCYKGDTQGTTSHKTSRNQDTEAWTWISPLIWGKIMVFIEPIPLAPNIYRGSNFYEGVYSTSHSFKKLPLKFYQEVHQGSIENFERKGFEG